MKVSREQMAQNRLRILEAASRLFRDKGFEAVSVVEVMKAAGLTHGGFYGHFESKDDLVGRRLCMRLPRTVLAKARSATSSGRTWRRDTAIILATAARRRAWRRPFATRRPQQKRP